MYCAICDQNNQAVNAIAICLRCGSGVCRSHLQIVISPGTPQGMVGMSPPTRKCVCLLCLESAQTSPAPIANTPRTSTPELPDAQKTLQAAEALLHEKRQIDRPGMNNPLRRIWQWLTGRTPRAAL